MIATTSGCADAVRARKLNGVSGWKLAGVRSRSIS
jgi:hypothetical protein